MKNFKALNILLFSFLLWSCEQEVIEKYEPVTVDPPPPVEATSGEADFSKYIAVGNSLTAGFMNGALYTEGQNNSFTNILAGQFALAGGGAFNQPDINSENGFFALGPGGFILGRLRLSAATNTPAPIIPGEIPSLFEGDKAALNNFGVPGVTLLTALIPQTGGPSSASNPAFNLLYARFASQVGTSTLMGDAAAALADGGTFFTFWLGNNDVLGYATGGASNPDILTSVDDFQERYNTALGMMLAANVDAKGMIANIPNVTDIPYFKTVTYNAIPLDQSAVDQLDSLYEDFNTGIMAYNAGLLPDHPAPPADQQRPIISFAPGQNAIVIADETLKDLSENDLPSIRQATTKDLIILPAGQVLGVDGGEGPLGLAVPLGDNFVLVPGEIEEIAQRIDDFNEIISMAANANPDRIGLVDINTIFSQFAVAGFSGNNVFITASLAPPFGAFSLDGVHPNARGNAFLANKFIEAINSKFGATLPLVNIAAYAGNELPQ